MGFRDLFVEKVVDEETHSNYSGNLPDFGFGDCEGEDWPTIDSSNVAEFDEINGPSIFKVRDLKATLPDTMPEVDKRKTVTSLLGMVGMTVEDAVLDGEKKLDIIDNRLADLKNRLTETINGCKDHVEECKLEIKKYEEAIRNYEEELKNAESSAEVRAKEIASLVDFIKER